MHVRDDRNRSRSHAPQKGFPFVAVFEYISETSDRSVVAVSELAQAHAFLPSRRIDVPADPPPAAQCGNPTAPGRASNPKDSTETSARQWREASCEMKSNFPLRRRARSALELATSGLEDLSPFPARRPGSSATGSAAGAPWRNLETPPSLHCLTGGTPSSPRSPQHLGRGRLSLRADARVEVTSGWQTVFAHRNAAHPAAACRELSTTPCRFLLPTLRRSIIASNSRINRGVAGENGAAPGRSRARSFPERASSPRAASAIPSIPSAICSRAVVRHAGVTYSGEFV